MSDTMGPERILCLTDGSPAAQAAVRAATEIAASLRVPLAFLGVSDGSGTGTGTGDDAAIESGLKAAHDHAKERIASVETIRATGELLEVAERLVSETPTALVVVGSRPRSGTARRRIAASVWQLVRSLGPAVLVTPAREFAPRRALFCTGGERFIEQGARLAARVAAALGTSVTVFHVSPLLPAMYGDRMRQEELDPVEFLASNSRLARNIRRQIDIFRSAGVDVTLRLAAGDVVSRVIEEVRRAAHDILIVGSSPARGPISAYMLGDLTRDIVGLSGLPFLVVRSGRPGLWTEIWRSLKEGAVSASTDPSDAKSPEPTPPDAA